MDKTAPCFGGEWIKSIWKHFSLEIFVRTSFLATILISVELVTIEQI